jgi:hypothetical protein
MSRAAERILRCVWFPLVCLPLIGRPAEGQAATPEGCPNTAFDTRPWLEDFHQLTAEMAAHYADLEYAVEGRHMDLPKLRQETEAALRDSCDEHEARHALEAFLKSFGDGHVRIDWPQLPAEPIPPPEAASLCARLGYKKDELAPGIDFGLLPQFSGIGGAGDDWFPGGLLRVTTSKTLGVIRIPIFTEHGFPDACEQVVRDMNLTNSEPCDKGCARTITYKTSDRLTAAVLMRAVQLQKAGASAILIDVDHNDGGSDWVDAVVRTLSPIPLRESDWGFIKHEHWTKELQDRLSEVEADLKNGHGSDHTLQEAATRLRSGIVRSKEKCDLNNVWDDNKLKCSLVVSGLIYSSGILPYAAPRSFAQLESKTVLFRPLRYSYTESSARLPLYVVVDAHTWSSAEYFAFLLQDNGAARIVGEVTGGAGCGFTNGGIPTMLKNSHASVKMPDCVHFRKDGSNANAGVTPDILVPWSGHDSSYLRAEKLRRSLESVVAPDSK